MRFRLRFSSLLVPGVLLFAASGAVSQMDATQKQVSADVCPLVVRVEKNGTFMTNRFSGWYKTSPALLESDLRGGCYNDSHPSHVTSVRLEISPGSPVPRLELLYRILDRNGWQKGKIAVQSPAGETTGIH